jgi:hypothetical protein
MASIVKIKRSSVQGKRPTTSDIQSGELALNTRDGKLFSSDGSAVFEVGANTTSLNVGTLTIGNSSPYTLPISDGTSGQVLTTDGVGTLSFATPSSGGTDSLGYTNSTITGDTLFRDLDSGVDLGDLSAGSTTDAFGVLINGERLDCMEPIREVRTHDFAVLS